MGNDSRLSLKNRGNDTKGRHGNGKEEIASGLAASGSSALRRSARETPSKKMVPGTPASQKSESREKGAPTSPPLTRSSDRLKEQKTSSPLRRSERCKNQGGSLSSSGLEPSSRSPGSSHSKGKKRYKGNNMRQLPVDRREVGKNGGDNEGSVQMRKKRHVHAYLSLFQKQDKEVDASDDHSDFTTQNKYHQPDQRDSRCEDLGEVNGSFGNCQELGNDGQCVREIVEQHCAENSFIPAQDPVDSTERAEDATKLESTPEDQHLTPDKVEANVMTDDAERAGSNSVESKLPDEANVKTSDGAMCIPDKVEATVMVDDVKRAGIHSLEPKLSGDANLRTSDGAICLEISPVVINEEQGNSDPVDIDIPASTSHVNTASVPLVSRGEAEVVVSCALDEWSNKDSQPLKPSKDVGTSGEQEMNSVCKLGRKFLLECWVPVHLSNVQLEQYCATLLEQEILLRSHARSDPVGALRDLVIANRKCCDHPYLVEQSVYGLLTRDLEPENCLDFGIKASGKLELLYKMLSELKNRGLRALILFQNFGKDSIGDFLEDLVRPKFGEDSYERVDARFTKKQNAVKRFNDQKCGRSFLLLETRACHSSIKLSLVDVVIIYSSDWNPANDIKYLQKILVESQFEQIKLFRFYCSCTIEEKVLICAKQGIPLDDSKLQNTNSAINHMLLMWGASYLFTKLEEFQRNFSSSSCMNSSVDSVQSLITDVLGEFLTLLPRNMESNSRSCSNIIKVEQISGLYNSSYPLFGESKIQCAAEGLPHVFWANLLQGKRPRWKFMLPHMNRKRVRVTDHLPKELEPDNNEHDKKRRKLASINSVPSSCKPGMDGDELAPGGKGGSSRPAILSVGRTQGTDEGNAVGSNVVLQDAQRSLYILIKPEVSRLCETLDLPDDLKSMVENFLQYVIKNRHVNMEPETILQAFQLAVCWTSASLLKKKIRHRESIDLAVKHLNYRCKKEEVEQVYSMLRELKKMFLEDMGNFGVAQSPEATDIVDLVQSGANSPHSAIACPQNSKVQTMGLTLNQDSSNKEFCTTQMLEHEFQLPGNDTSKASGEIETALQRQFRVEYETEKNAACTRYKSLKEMLENQHRMEASIIRHMHQQVSLRMDRLAVLDRDYAKRFQHIRNLFVAELKKLEENCVAAKEKARQEQASSIDSDGQGEKQAGLMMAESQHGGDNMDRNDAPDCLMVCTSPQTLPSEAVVSPVERATDPVRINGEHCELNTGTSEGPQVTGFDQCAGIGSGTDQESAVHLNSLPVENPPDGTASGGLDQDVSLPVCGTVVSAGLEKATSATLPASKEQIAHGSALSRPEREVSLTVAETETGVSLDVAEPMVAIVTNIPDGVVPPDSDHDPPSVVCEAVPCTSFGTAVTALALEEQISGGAMSNERACVVPLIASTSSMNANVAAANPPSENAIHNRGTTNVSEAHALLDDTLSCVCSDDNLTLETSQRLLGASKDIGACDNPDDVTLPNPPSSEVQISDGPVSELPGNVESIGNPAFNVNQHFPCLPDGQVQRQSAEVSIPQVEIAAIDREAQAVPREAHGSHVVDTLNDDGHTVHQNSDSRNTMLEVSSTTSHQEASVHVSSDQLCREGQVLIQRIENHMSPSNEAGLQTSTSSTQCTPSVLHTGLSNFANSAALSPAPAETSVALLNRMPLQHYQNPLQYELDKLLKIIDSTTKEHETTKTKLKSDCEKEIEEAIAEIRRKYDKKLQEIEVDYMQKKEQLKSSYSKVQMNKILADAFRDKCMDLKGSQARGAHDTISSYARQLLSSSSQQNAPFVPLVPGSSSAVVSPVNMRSTAPSTPSIAQPGLRNAMAPSIQTLHHAAAIMCGAASGPSHISHGIPPMVNAQVGSQLCSPSPHVQPLGSASLAAARAILSAAPSLNMPTQQGNTIAVSGSFPHFPSPMVAPSTHRARLLASNNPVGGLPAGNNSISAMELLMDVTSQQMASQACNFSSQSMALPKPVHVSAANPFCGGNNPISTEPTPDVVCLSDDD